MASRHIFLVVALGFVLLLLGATATRLGLAKVGPASADAVAGPPPATVTADLHPFSGEITAIGVVKAQESVTLTAPTTELATKILFTNGQHVANGQVLAELKSDEQQAAVVNAESMLHKAESDEARWQALDQKGFAPNQLRAQGHAVREAVLEAATVQLRPVVMTSLSAVMGATPLMLAQGPGAGSQRTIGVTVFTGAIFGTLLTLYVVPVFYNLVAGVGRARRPISPAAARPGQPPRSRLLRDGDGRVTSVPDHPP